MKKRAILAKMISGERRRSVAKAASVSASDGVTGVPSLSLENTVGGFRPLAVRVGGAPPPASASLDSPASLPFVGEHSVDRISRGFFGVFAENVLEIPYDTEGLTATKGVKVSVTLGSAFDGTLTLSIGEESTSLELSGEVGLCRSLSFSGEAAPYGTLRLLSSADCTLRLTLHGEGETGRGLALTLLACDEDGKSLSDTKILLPTPLVSLSNLCENRLYLPEGRIESSVGISELSPSAKISLGAKSDTLETACFEVSHGIPSRADGALMSCFGEISGPEQNVLSAHCEGLSLLSAGSARFAVSLSFERLSDGVLALDGILRTSGGTGSPSAPASPVFSPSEGTVYFTDRSGSRYRLALSEPLRAVGDYSDRLYVCGRRSTALRATRIGKLILTGEEPMRFSLSDGYSVATIPFSGGQMTAAQNDLPGLCTRAEYSALALTSPGEVESTSVYLGSDALYIAMRRGNTWAESEYGLRAYLRSAFSTPSPFCLYYPLAEERQELIPLTPISSLGTPENASQIAPKIVSSFGKETLLALFRLWLFGQSEPPWLLYPLRQVSTARVLETKGELRLPDRGTILSAVGEGKARTLSLAAYVYLDGATASTQSAAGSEDTSMPQKGSK